MLIEISLSLIGCSSDIYYRPVPYQEASTTTNQRLFRENRPDTVLLVLIKDKYLNLKRDSDICVYFFEANNPELKKKINSFTYYPYRIKKNSDKLVGCVAWRQKILMYIPLNGKKEREIVLGLGLGSPSESETIRKKKFILRKSEPQYYRWGEVSRDYGTRKERKFYRIYPKQSIKL